jgi:hypothetical protein
MLLACVKWYVTFLYTIGQCTENINARVVWEKRDIARSGRGQS